MAHSNKPKMKLKYRLRLHLLVHMLRHHGFYFPKVEFDLDDWVQKKEGCGTAACAVGSACMWKPFNIMGLHYEEYSWGIAPWGPVFNKRYHWGAVQEFFGLTHNTAMEFFLASSYPTNSSPDDVADRILQYLKEGRPND